MYLLLHIAPLAAGAVGVIVGQLCKHVYGCRVVGAAGTDEKVGVAIADVTKGVTYGLRHQGIKE
jgi:NADPH-dependent curcumin reductase CurA